MSKTVKINPLFVLIAILVGANIGSVAGGFFGAFVGTLIAIPVAGSIQVDRPRAVAVDRRRTRPRRTPAWRPRLSPASTAPGRPAPLGRLRARTGCFTLLRRAGPGRAAHLQRVREHRARPATRPRGPARRRHPRRRRRQPRRHRRHRRAGWARSSAASTSCAGRPSPASAARTGPGSPGASSAAGRPSSRWTPTSPTTPPPFPSLVAPLEDGADLAVGSRYVPGARSRTGAGTAVSCRAAATSTPRAVLGLGITDATSGFRAYRGRDPRDHRPRSGPGRGLRLPDRDGPPGPRARGPGGRGARSASSTGSRASRRCRCTSSSRPWSSSTWWGLRRLGRSGSAAAPPSSPTARAPEHAEAGGLGRRLGRYGVSAPPGSSSSTTSPTSPTCSAPPCASRGSRSRRRPPGARPWPWPTGATTTSSSSTSCCPTSRAPRCAGGCATRGSPRRCCSSRPATPPRTRWPAYGWAATTT